MEDKQKKSLRKGYTTGTCAAAAAKAAAIAFLGKKKISVVEVTLPNSGIASIPVHRCEIEKNIAKVSIKKEAGDDPDVTNKAEIVAEIQVQGAKDKRQGVRGKGQDSKAFQFTIHGSRFTVYGGKGIGMVTKPGLAVKVGEPAINPVPRKMIKDALSEVVKQFTIHHSQFTVVISVPHGEEIAKKTMNARLGIIGGISILGTTGIVEPVSLSAYRQSISCAIDVALASGCRELVFSTGRSSEKVAEKLLDLPETAFIIVGDHMGFALKEVRREVGWAVPTNILRKITIAGQFGKLSKLAAGHFETHCSDSSVDLDFVAALTKKADAGSTIIKEIQNANTARQVSYILQENKMEKVFKMLCEKVNENSEMLAHLKTQCILIGYEGEVVFKQ